MKLKDLQRSLRSNIFFYLFVPENNRINVNLIGVNKMQPRPPVDVSSVPPGNLFTSDISSRCTICMEMLNNSEVYCIPECQHVFHSQCIITWLRQNQSCPLCRSEPAIDGSIRRSYISDKCKVNFLTHFAKENPSATPKQLKQLINKYKRQTKNLADAQRHHREWKKSEEGQQYAALSKVNAKFLRRTSWSTKRKHRVTFQEIAQYPIMPALVVSSVT